MQTDQVPAFSWPAQFALAASATVRTRFASRDRRSPGAVGDGTPRPAVSFIVATREGAASLARCLASIRDGRYPADRVEILVLDRGWRDGTYAVARAAGARIVALPHLRGSALRNVAARAARGEVLAFVDADQELDPNWAAAAVETLALEGVGAAGAAGRAPAGGTWVQRLNDAFHQRVPGRQPVDGLEKGSFAVRREAFERAGGFDASPGVPEPADLCRRLHAHGYRVMSDPALKSVDTGGPATLGAVVRAELRRGRKTAASGRHRRLPIPVIPATGLALLFLTALGRLALPAAGAIFLLATAVAVSLAAAVRTARVVSFGGDPQLQTVLRAYVVAWARELGRTGAPLLVVCEAQARVQDAVAARLADAAARLESAVAHLARAWPTPPGPIL